MAYDEELLERLTTNYGEIKLCCPNCPKRAKKRGKIPTVPRDQPLGRFRILKRLPCVASEADLGHITLKGHSVCL
jgi:hypothetical protein